MDLNKYAMAQVGNAAYQSLYAFSHGFVGENGFHHNGDFKKYGYCQADYRPFTLEACFGYCDALHEMLMQDHMGYIHVFPAIPDEWKQKEISFTDLRSRGGVLVSAKHGPEGLRQVQLKNERPCAVRLLDTFGGDTLSVCINGKEELLQAEEGILTVFLPEAGTALLTANK